jgi:hypothetical protein
VCIAGWSLPADVAAIDHDATPGMGLSVSVAVVADFADWIEGAGARHALEGDSAPEQRSATGEWFEAVPPHKIHHRLRWMGDGAKLLSA